jgi:hypothetical protein
LRIKHDIADMLRQRVYGLALGWPFLLWRISGSRALSAFLVELGAPMMVASTMVPVLILKPRACNCLPTWANRASPNLLLSKQRNLSYSILILLM